MLIGFDNMLLVIVCAELFKSFSFHYIAPTELKSLLLTVLQICRAYGA